MLFAVISSLNITSKKISILFSLSFYCFPFSLSFYIIERIHCWPLFWKKASGLGHTLVIWEATNSGL